VELSQVESSAGGKSSGESKREGEPSICVARRRPGDVIKRILPELVGKLGAE